MLPDLYALIALVCAVMWVACGRFVAERLQTSIRVPSMLVCGTQAVRQTYVAVRIYESPSSFPVWSFLTLLAVDVALLYLMVVAARSEDV